LEVSPVTTAPMRTCAPTAIAFGGKALELNIRVMLGVPITIMADTLLVLSATAVAVTVTELLLADGNAEGAV
jgi:hypothetical protein